VIVEIVVGIVEIAVIGVGNEQTTYQMGKKLDWLPKGSESND
jgi:hypothetical protein